MPMEFLLFVIVTIILVIVLGIRKVVIDRFKILDTKVDYLTEQLKKAQLRREESKEVVVKQGFADEPRVVQPARVAPPIIKPISSVEAEPVVQPLSEKPIPTPV